MPIRYKQKKLACGYCLRGSLLSGRENRLAALETVPGTGAQKKKPQTEYRLIKIALNGCCRR